MSSFRTISSALAGTMLIATAGCGSSEPTAEEKAETARLYQAQKQQQLADDIAAFPSGAPQMIATLEAMSVRDVSDMDAATDTIRFFDRAAMNVRIIEDAAREGRAPVPEQAIVAKDQLKRILIRKQRELFPALRRTYAAYMSDAVAGARANFRAVGADAKTLRGASPSFSSREVVMEAHYTVASQATRFRFSRAEYVYSIDGSSDVVAMNGKADDDIGS